MKNKYDTVSHSKLSIKYFNIKLGQLSYNNEYFILPCNKKGLYSTKNIQIKVLKGDPQKDFGVCNEMNVNNDFLGYLVDFSRLKPLFVS